MTDTLPQSDTSRSRRDRDERKALHAVLAALELDHAGGLWHAGDAVWQLRARIAELELDNYQLTQRAEFADEELRACEARLRASIAKQIGPPVVVELVAIGGEPSEPR